MRTVALLLLLLCVAAYFLFEYRANVPVRLAVTNYNLRTLGPVAGGLGLLFLILRRRR